MENSVQTTEKVEKTSGASKMLEIVAYPFAAFIGLFVGGREISNAAYDNAKKMGAVGISPEHRARLSRIGAQADRAVRAGGTFDLIKATEGEFTQHAGKVAKQMEGLGLGSISKKWNFTNYYHKQNAVMSGLTAAGVTIGALLIIAESKIFKEYFADKSSDNQQQR